MANNGNGTTAVAQPTVDPKVITEKTVCLILDRGKFGRQRKARTLKADPNQPIAGAGFPGGIITDADPKMVKATKTLLDSKELTAINGLFNRVRTYLEERCLPAPMFKRGIWCLPIELLEETDAALTAFADELAKMVDDFVKPDEGTGVSLYETRCEEAESKLKSLYNAGDYPTPGRFKASFFLSWQYTAFGVPQVLKKLKGAFKEKLFERESKKMEDRMRTAAQDVEAGLCATFLELIRHMREALTPEDGRRKHFHKAHIERVTKFIDLFAARNVTDNKDLDRLVGKARDILEGVETDDLRGEGSEMLRDAMQKELVGVEKDLDKLVELAPRRAIQFDDDV